MINWFKVKKYLTFLLVSAIPLVIFFFSLLKLGDLIMAALAWLAATMLMMFVGSRLMRHPMMQMVEGDGLLGMTIDSTGLIQPFLIRVIPPFMHGRLGKKNVEDVWDRNATFYLKPPKEGQLAVAEDDSGELYEVIVLGKAGEDHNDKIFSFEGHLVFIFNKALNTFITKDMLAQLESRTMAKHVILYLSKRTEELTAMIRDFARYIVEQTKPKKFFGLGNWFIVIVIVAILLIMILMFPAFLDIFSNAGGIVQTLPRQPVTPR